jgi:tRNA 5-methylaminomethyl-2-thiouridine biosynthesis bifunctional protein
MSVEPDALAFDATGAPFSPRYGDVYASRDGALGQARHVFLGGTRTVERWRRRAQFVILETGFGLGTNFLAAWQAWRSDPARPQRLHFVSVEKHPLPSAALTTAAPSELQELAAELAGQWPPALAGLHRCEFDDGRVALTLALGDARDVVPQLVVGADALFLDGFAPERNPAMWERPLLRAVARLARPECLLATWSTARAVRETLALAGFDVELAPGFGHKRQMMIARYAPRYIVRRRDPAPAYEGARSAIVIGAGLAGAACADALARRNWCVEVLDSAVPGRGASALPWGLMHPHFSADDNRLARLTRAGSAMALRAMRRVAPGGRHAGQSAWQTSGVFQKAASDVEARRWCTTVEHLRLPPEYVRWVDAAAATALLGVAPAQAGLWWPGGVVASPARISLALLDQPRIRCVQQAVGQLSPEADGWVACGVDGRPLAHAAIAVVATGIDAPRLLNAKHLPVRAVGGQVTHVVSELLQSLRAALAGDGTLLRSPDGDIVIGATYEVLANASGMPLDQRSAARSNLARLERLLAAPGDVRADCHFASVRCVARDRLPFAGRAADEAAALLQCELLRGAQPEELPRRPGLFASFALGSRGLSFASLAGELIAAQIEGEPLPVERDLANAVDPARVLLQRLRRAGRAGLVEARPVR